MSSQRDTVSQTIGSMLLQGYKMLADSCSTCNSVLMQDKKGVIICVNCNTTKETEPSTTTMEVEHAKPSVVPNAGGTTETQLKRKHVHGDRYQMKAMQAAEEALYQEMKFAADVLNMNPPLDISERLVHVQFIKECAEAIKSLHGIPM